MRQQAKGPLRVAECVTAANESVVKSSADGTICLTAKTAGNQGAKGLFAPPLFGSVFLA